MRPGLPPLRMPTTPVRAPCADFQLEIAEVIRDKFRGPLPGRQVPGARGCPPQHEIISFSTAFGPFAPPPPREALSARPVLANDSQTSRGKRRTRKFAQQYVQHSLKLRRKIAVGQYERPPQRKLLLIKYPKPRQ